MITPYEPQHAMDINIQIEQFTAQRTRAHAEVLAKGHCAWTCIADGVPIACAGILPIWNDRGLCWAMLSQDAGPHMVEITRATREALDACPYRRVEMNVRPDFWQGWRWAYMLGFVYEAMLEEADPDGGDLALFKRIRKPRLTRGVGMLKGD